MDSLHLIARAPELTGMAARGGQWLLPWACVLVLAGTVAHVADQALGHALVEQPAPNQSLLEPLQRPPADAGFRWVVLSSADTQAAQRSLTCLMPADRVSADVLQVRAGDLDAVASGVCATSSPDRSAASEGR